MKSKLTKVFSIMVSLVITIAMLVLPAQTALAAVGTVDLVLLPATQTVDPGDDLVVTVQAQAGAESVDGVGAYIDFNPDHLAVQSITLGTGLGITLQNVFNNTLGTIDFSVGQLTAPFPTGNFNVATITFTVKDTLATTETAVSFHAADVRITAVTFAGATITGALTGGTYTINDITPPTVLAIAPVDTATDVPIGGAVAITFSEAMGQAATEGAFSITPAAAGAFSWNVAGTILTYTPTADLALNTEYTIGISVAAVDIAATPNHLAAAFASSFTTQVVVPAPPAVTTEAAADMTNATATLNANLASMGTADPVTVSFQYGYTDAYGKTTATQELTAAGAFNAAVTGLLPGTSYHYRAVAVGDGTVYGDDMVVTTTGFTTRFTFISARDGNEEVYAMTPDGANYARLTENTFKEAWPRLLPDFTRVTFTSWRDGNAEVYWMYPDGTIQTRLTDNAAFDGMSDYSWDGTKIVFVSERDGNYEIYVMNADGTGQTRLTTNAFADFMPAFSPDGTQIAFVSNRDGNYEIYVMNADGTGQTRLTDNAAADTYPSWLLDGTSISFDSQRDGNGEIYTMDADGSNPVRLTNNAVTDDQSFWCPTGNAIVYTSRISDIPQVIFIGMQAYAGMSAQFTDSAEGNWSRANWTLPSTQTYTVNASVSGGNGTVAPVSQTVLTGADATINITPDAGYTITVITDNGTPVAVVNPYVISNVTADHTIVVTFSDKYTITVTSGANGTVTPDGEILVDPGTDQSFTITPADGYHIDSITDNGVAMPIVNPYVILNVSANHTVAVTFSNNYTVTATAGANGTVTPLGVIAVNPGDDLAFAIAANIGYHIADVLVDGESVGAVVSYNFVEVMANHTLVASFAINDSLVEILKSIAEGTDDGYSTSGSGDFNPDTSWFESGTPVLDANNNAWFRFTGITIPANAVIDEAYLELIQSKWDVGALLKIYAEASDNPLAPINVDDHAGRVRTTNGVAWTSGYSDSTWHTSPNFAPVIQELLAGYTYSDGVIQILLDNNGSAEGTGIAGYTFENTGFAPRLYIRYHLEASVTTGAATGTTTTTVTLNGELTSMGSADSVAVSFEYGTTTAYGTAAAGTPASLTATGVFTANLTGLTAGTTYYYRAKAVGTGTVYGAQGTFTTTAAPLPPPAPPAQPVAPAPAPAPVVTTVEVTGMSGTAPVVDAQGVSTADSVLTSTDAQASISIPAGTKMLDGSGAALDTVSCVKLASPPAPPANNVVVVGYDFGPDGATFEPAITITLHFNTADLPAGTVLSNLKLAFWDGTVWQILSNTQVNTATGEISAEVTHFTNFAILSVLPPVAVVTPTTPAVTTVTEPAPAEVTTPTATETPVEPPAVAPPAEAAVTETTQTVTTPATPAPSNNFWWIFGAIAFIVIGVIFIIAIAIRTRRRV